jgi:hypothetical protein
MDPDPDFPAAHSMDTTWFAVDRDGHVACLVSGESGAVPEAACREPGEGARLLEEFRAATDLRTEMIHDFHGRVIPRLEPKGSHIWGPRLVAYDRTDILMFLANHDPIREELASGLAVPLPSRGAAAVRFEVLTKATAARLHESGECLSCFNYWFVLKEDWSPAALGFFSYHHLCLNWLSGPYGLLQRPRDPVRIEQLPAALREAAERVRLDTICFAEAPRLQPVDFARCQSWEYAYLDADGTTIRAIPGREDGYRSVYSGYAKDPELRVEPPPPPKRPAPREDPREARRRLRAERANAPRRPASRPARRAKPDGSGVEPLNLDEALALILAETENTETSDEADLTDSVAQLIMDGLSPGPDVMANLLDALEVAAEASKDSDDVRSHLLIAIMTLMMVERYTVKPGEPDTQWRAGLIENEIPRLAALLNKLAGLDDEPGGLEG